jgi:hypothetical protein
LSLARVLLGFITATVLCTTLWLARPAGAKDFKPGDIRVCAAAQCMVLRNRQALNTLGDFYYREARVPKATKAPPSHSRYVELRFPNGYVSGIMAGAHFDHFLSYGVNVEQFKARTWYAVPPRAATAIARLAAQLHPRPLPANVLGNSH